MGEPLIDVVGLVKSFGATRVLDELDLQVVPGEVHGFLGASSPVVVGLSDHPESLQTLAWAFDHASRGTSHE